MMPPRDWPPPHPQPQIAPPIEETVDTYESVTDRVWVLSIGRIDTNKRYLVVASFSRELLEDQVSTLKKRTDGTILDPDSVRIESVPFW